MDSSVSPSVNKAIKGRLASTALSPGRSENLNKSYALAQISASGKTSYDSTAVTFGLFGCRREERSKASLQPAKEASMSLIWAFRETSIGADMTCFLILGEKMGEHVKMWYGYGYG